MPLVGEFARINAELDGTHERLNAIDSLAERLERRKPFGGDSELTVQVLGPDGNPARGGQGGGVGRSPFSPTFGAASIAGGKSGGVGGSSGVLSKGSPSGSGVLGGIGDFDPSAIAAAVSGIPIPPKREWDPRGLGGLLDAKTILITVSTYGAASEFPLLQWCAGWIAYANPTLSAQGSGGLGTTAGAFDRFETLPDGSRRLKKKQSTGPQGGADIGIADVPGGLSPRRTAGGDTGPGIGSVTKAVRDSGSQTTAATREVVSAVKRLTAVVERNGGLNSRTEGAP